MPVNILMPALSPTMEEGKLSKWLVKEGDEIVSGDVIAEIETDKATMEVEAVEEGRIGKILVDGGTDGVKVNAVIAILLEEGEDESALKDAPQGGAPKAAPPAPQPPKQPKPEPVAPDYGGAVQGGAAPQGSPAPKSDGGRVFSSPLARRVAGQNNIDLAQVKGTGPHGRVVLADVEAAIKSGGTKPAAAAEKPAAAPAAAPAQGAAPAAPLAMSGDKVLQLFEEGSYELVAHDGMRKTIARRLLEAKATIPHFYVTIDCNIDALLTLRAQLNEAAPKDKEGKPAYKLSVNDLVIKAHAMALKAVPEANVSWTEDNMVKHHNVDVGVAVSIPGGLITPIIRKADEKSLSAISNEMKDLAARARNRKLQPKEYQGGSTAVSNLGMFGVKDFAAIVNPPHATILAVGAGRQEPVVVNGEIKVATIMSVTLSTDHRAVDGALAAELAAAFKGYIENPFGMLV